jgi:hypothetical protein
VRWLTTQPFISRGDKWLQKVNPRDHLVDESSLTCVPLRASIVSAQIHRRLKLTTQIATFTYAAEWERTLYAFLAEKERRSGSRRTVESYSRMLYHFFGTLGKTPDQVTAPEVFAYAHGIGLSGKNLHPSPSEPESPASVPSIVSSFGWASHAPTPATPWSDLVPRQHHPGDWRQVR